MTGFSSTTPGLTARNEVVGDPGSHRPVDVLPAAEWHVGWGKLVNETESRCKATGLKRTPLLPLTILHGSLPLGQIDHRHQRISWLYWFCRAGFRVPTVMRKAYP